MKKIGLLPRLLIGIALGILVGYLSKLSDFYLIVELLSTFTGVFGKFLAFVIPLIILGFVIPGISDLGTKAGKLLGITALISYGSSVLAGLLAFWLGGIILPDLVSAVDFGNNTSKIGASLFEIDIPPLMDVMTALVLAFTLGLGIAYTNAKAILKVSQDFHLIVVKLVNGVIIPLIPIHVSGIFCKLTASGEIINIMSTFSVVIILIIALQLFFIVIQYFISGTFTSRNPFLAIRNMLPAYFTALGTQSSAAAIPVTLTCVQKNGVKEDVADFVVPLCATIHLAGDTITLVLGAMTILLMNGQMADFSLMFPFIMMLGITMVAAPGIPGGGVMASLGLLENMLLFSSGQIGMMIAIHFAQDSFGTAANVTGDGAIALLMNKMALKEEDVESEILVQEL